MNILDLPMQDNDAGAATVRSYLKALLSKLWKDRECFSGKRPFGNSAWNYDLYTALVTAGAVAGELDCDGGIDSVDDAEADKLIAAAIDEL